MWAIWCRSMSPPRHRHVYGTARRTRAPPRGKLGEAVNLPSTGGELIAVGRHRGWGGRQMRFRSPRGIFVGANAYRASISFAVTICSFVSFPTFLRVPSLMSFFVKRVVDIIPGITYEA